MPDARHLVVAVAVVLAAACGEPPVDVDLPARADGQQVLDSAGVLRADEVTDRLAALRGDGLDVVALTYETSQAGCGEAFRAGGRLVEAWDADVAIVAVARPGDFEAAAGEGRRCVGISPRDQRAISGDLRESIVEDLVPPLAQRNAWTEVFVAAATALEQEAP